MAKTKQPKNNQINTSGKMDTAEIDDALLFITQKELEKHGAVLKSDHVEIKYTEVIAGQTFSLLIDIYATNGLYFVRGNLGTVIDAACQDCLANFYDLVNSLYVDPVVFYGKIFLQGAKAEYNLLNYYPYTTVPLNAFDSWHYFIPVVYQSARKDITRFLKALKDLSEFTRLNGCKSPQTITNTTH